MPPLLRWFPKLSSGGACLNGHAIKLRKIKWPCPAQPAFGEHFELRLDQVRAVQAAQHDEDETREAFQIAGEQPGTASGTEITVKCLARFNDIAVCFCGAGYEEEATARSFKLRAAPSALPTAGPATIIPQPLQCYWNRFAVASNLWWKAETLSIPGSSWSGCARL